LPQNLPHVRALLMETLKLARRIGRHRTDRIETIAGLFANIDPDQGLAIALSISDSAKRRAAVGLVVYTMATTDPQEALALALRVRRKDGRVSALSSLLEALQPGSPFVAPVGDAAARIARSIEHKVRRDAALATIVDALTDHDPERAMELALSIGRPKLRGRAMQPVIRNIGAKDPNRALKVAETIKYLGTPDIVKRVIASELAETAPDKAMKLVRSIADPALRVWEEFQVRLAHAKLAKTRLRKAHNELLALAHRIRNPYYPDTTPTYRASALAALAQAWIELGLAIPKALRRELTSIVGILDYRDSVRVAIAEAMVAWDPEGALEIVEGVEPYYVLPWAEEEAACRLAATDPQRAVAAARNIKDRSYRPYALQSVAAVMASADSDAALAAIRRVRSKPTRMSLMRGWAEEVAKQDPKRALAVARKQGDDDVRGQMLIAITGVLGASDLRRAIKLAGTIADERARYEALFAVAWAALP
jgi:hypothetical protein